MRICFVLAYLLLLSNLTLANYESIRLESYGIDKYQSLARGSGIIGPPYQEDFEYLLVFEPGWLHFVFDYPLDPGQLEELDEYQASLHLNWIVSCLKINDQHWTSISVPVAKDSRSLSASFLQQLSQLTFFVDLH